MKIYTKVNVFKSIYEGGLTQDIISDSLKIQLIYKLILKKSKIEQKIIEKSSPITHQSHQAQEFKLKIHKGHSV